MIAAGGTSWSNDLDKSKWTLKWGWEQTLGDDIFKYIDYSSDYLFSRANVPSSNSASNLFGLKLDLNLNYDWTYNSQYTNFFDWYSGWAT